MRDGAAKADRPSKGTRKREPDGAVSTLARQQRQLFSIGGGVLTALVLTALVIGMLMAYRDMYAERDEVVRDGQSSLVDILQQRNLGAAGYAALSDGVWNTQGERLSVEGRKLAIAFKANANVAVVRGSPTALPWLVLGRSDLELPERTLAKYLGMAREYSLLSRSTSLFEDTYAGPGAAFEYDPTHALILVAGLDSDMALRDALSADTNDEAIDKLIEFDRRLSSRAITSRVGQREIRFAFAPNPLNRRPAIYTSLPLGSGLNVHLRRVFFEPTQVLRRRLQSRGVGELLLLAPDGQTILDTLDRSPRLEAREAQAILSQASGNPSRRQSWSSSTHLAVFGPVAGTDWILVHPFSRSDLWSAIIVRGALPLAVALLVITGLWMLLLRIQQRVLRPALADAERVFESEALSRTIIDTSPVGLSVIDAEGCVLLQNQRAAALLSRDALRAVLQEASPKHTPRPNKDRFKLECENADGDRVEVSVAPIGLNEAPSWLCVLRDVTAERELEQIREVARDEAERAKEHAEEASRAKSSFVASISHEIRTPLHGIAGHLELLAQSPLNAEQAERVERIRQSADSLMSMISDVLDFSKIEAGQLELELTPFSVRQLIERTAVLFAPQAMRKRLSLVTYVSPRLAECYVSDPKHLQQILHNLVSNAIKFTSTGQIIVSAHLRYTETEARKWIAFSVKDTGIGMSAQQQANLFQPFTQADTSIARRFGGTGLGLALSRELARLLDGRLALRSTKGRGSVFTLRIPATESKSVAPPRVLRGHKVTVVASRRRWRIGMAAYLSTRGATVSCKEHIGDARPTPDVTLWWVDEGRGHAGDDLGEGWRDVVMASMNGPLTPLEEGGLTHVSCYASAAWDMALDRHIDARQEAPRRVGRAPAAPLHGRVLLVDDHPVNRELIRQQLEVLGLLVDDAANGSEALLGWTKGRYVAVLTDVHMPEVSGYDVARAIRSMDPTVPIIAVTASALSSEREQCRQAGMTDLLLKPVLLNDLRSTLNKYLVSEQIKNLNGVASDARSVPAIAVRRLFAEQATADLSKFDQLVSARDTGGSLTLIHSLKGALLMLREHSAAALCAGVEQSLRRGPYDLSLASLAQLRGAIERIVERYNEAGP